MFLPTSFCCSPCGRKHGSRCLVYYTTPGIRIVITQSSNTTEIPDCHPYLEYLSPCERGSRRILVVRYKYSYDESLLSYRKPMSRYLTQDYRKSFWLSGLEVLDDLIFVPNEICTVESIVPLLSPSQGSHVRDRDYRIPTQHVYTVLRLP